MNASELLVQLSDDAKYALSEMINTGINLSIGVNPDDEKTIAELQELADLLDKEVTE